MALSEKARELLTQIYAYRGYGDEKFVSEDADEALEYVLQEIVNDLTSRLRDDASTPLNMAMRKAVVSLRLDWRERREVETS